MTDLARKWREFLASTGELQEIPSWLFKTLLVALPASAIVVPILLVAVPFLPFFNGMALQPKGKTQMEYGILAGEPRAVERPPVPGTVPRESIPYAYRGKTEGAVERGGGYLPNPLLPVWEDLVVGKARYDTFCVVCHGKTGQGDGTVVLQGGFPAPPSLHTEEARAFPDGQIYHLISEGRPGKMPPYGDKILPEDRWQVVYYLRALQRSLSPPAARASPP